MEHTLRCNNLKCRKELNDHAVVTTCCHIFCYECANQLQLLGQQEARRPFCPACAAQLPNPDDVVMTNLNPSEDYKTSVLSGLSPQIILECAGRALSFWAYQTAQEIVYHEYSAKTLNDKYATLNTQMDNVINDANSEVTSLRTKVANMEVDQNSIRRKNEELNNALREKTRKHLQTQEAYDKLKRRAMLGQVQNAAVDAVEDTIQASVAANRYTDAFTNQDLNHPSLPPLFSGQQSNVPQRARSFGSSTVNMGPPPIPTRGGLGEGSWTGFTAPTNSQSHQSLQTPSTHRQQIPSGGNGFNPSVGQPNPQLNTISRGSRASPRYLLTNISSNNAPTGFSGYGMSAGLKVSNPPGSANGMRPINRSRVAQRSASGGLPGRPTPNFGATNTTNMFSNGNYH